MIRAAAAAALAICLGCTVAVPSMSAGYDLSAADREELVRLAWHRGALDWKLYDYQLPLYQHLWEAIEDGDTLETCANIGRRFGKSTTMNLVALEFAIRNPGSQIRSAAPSEKELRNITQPIWQELLADCPAELKPALNAQHGVQRFPNGSQYHMAGTDNKRADKLRGQASDLSVLDEAGFMPELKYVVENVLMPQQLTTGGTMFLSSTPPPSNEHPYVDRALDLKDQGRYIHRTIHDTDWDDATKERFAATVGGMNSTAWRREYLAEFVTEAELAIVPEWSSRWVEPYEPGNLDHFYARYVAMDLGWSDQTAILWAVYDFEEGALFVEHEHTATMKDASSRAIAQAIKRIESQEGARAYRNPRMRVADNNDPKNLYELAQDGYSFHPTSKESLTKMVNSLRRRVMDGQVRVHPRCKKLIGCLNGGVWKDRQHIGREFGYSDRLGHYDALAALMYLVRNVAWQLNPIPDLHGVDLENTHVPADVLRRAKSGRSEVGEMLQNAFRVQRPGRVR